MTTWGRKREREKDGWMGWWVGVEGVMEKDKRRGWRGEGDAEGGRVWSRKDSIRCSLTPVKDEPRLASSSTVIKRTLMRIGYCNSNTLSAVFKAMDKSDPPYPPALG